MAWDLQLRAVKDAALMWPAAYLARVMSLFGISTDVLTLAGLFVGLAGAASVVCIDDEPAMRVAALSLWICNRVVDGIDGMVARLNRTESDFGAYFGTTTLSPLPLPAR